MYPLFNSWRVADILKWLGTNVKYHESIWRAHVWPRSLQGQSDILRSNALSCLSFEPLVGFTYNILTNVKFDESMCSAYAWLWAVQGKCHLFDKQHNAVYLHCSKCEIKYFNTTIYATRFQNKHKNVKQT